MKQRSPCWRRGKELAFLGIARSSAFVRAPEGNGCAERFIRTLQKNLLWIGTFETVEAMCQVLLTLREITDRHLAARTTWSGIACSHPQRAASIHGRGDMGSVMVGQEAGAVQTNQIVNFPPSSYFPILKGRNGSYAARPSARGTHGHARRQAFKLPGSWAQLLGCACPSSHHQAARGDHVMSQKVADFMLTRLKEWGIERI